MSTTNKQHDKWEMVRLGDVLSYEQPTKYLVESENYNDSYNIPVLTAGKSFVLGYTNEIQGIYTNLPVIIFDDFTTESKFVDFKFKAKSSAMKILTCDNTKAAIKFLFYLLQTINFDATQHKRYWISTFANLQIPLPPLPVQQRIAEILDTADALRRTDRELLQHYDNLAQSIFMDMFGDPVKNEKGWEVKRLGDVITIETKTVDPKTLDAYKYIGLEHIEKDSGRIIETSSVDAVSSKYIFNSNHIIYGKLRPYLNKVAEPKFSGICSTDIYPIVPKIKDMKSFIASILKSTDFVNYATINSVGANLPRVNKEVILNYQTICPNAEACANYSVLLNLIDEQKKVIENNSKNSDTLFNALLQQAFKGELVQ